MSNLTSFLSVLLVGVRSVVCMVQSEEVCRQASVQRKRSAMRTVTLTSLVLDPYCMVDPREEKVPIGCRFDRHEFCELLYLRAKRLRKFLRKGRRLRIESSVIDVNGNPYRNQKKHSHKEKIMQNSRVFVGGWGAFDNFYGTQYLRSSAKQCE